MTLTTIIPTMEPKAYSLQIVSDIHLEHRSINYDCIVQPIANILALVGDIGSPFLPNLSDFITWCASKFDHVFYIPGNHEYYNTQALTINDINIMLDDICKLHSNVHFMYNTVYDIGKYTFIGSTLWSHVPDEHIHTIQNIMNDYRYIFATNERRITVADTNVEYQKNKAFIEKSIQDAIVNNKIPIVLTHHTPSMKGTSSPMHEGGVSCYAFSSTLSCTPGIIRLWACGHTHYNFHHFLEGYELISNQFGYNDIGVKGYNPKMCIEL